MACNKADEIVEIDRESWATSRGFPTGRGPYNLAVTPDGGYVIASLKQGSGEGVGAQPGKVDVHGLTTLLKVGTVDVGQQASGIAFWKMEPPW